MTSATVALIGPAAHAVLQSGVVSVQADATIVGGAPFRQLGVFSAGVGDTNNDGYDDVVVVAQANLSIQTAYLFLGPVSGTSDVTAADAVLSAPGGVVEVAGAGDVNGDGFDDLIVANHLPQSAAGTAWVVYGPMSGPIDVDLVGAELRGEAPGDFAGNSIAGPGDVNGDGYDDVLIGAPGNDSGGSDAGAVYLVLGPIPAAGADLADAEAKIEGEAGDSFGTVRQMAAAGDVDGDGYADAIVGLREDDAAGEAAGGAFVFFGPMSGVLGPDDAGAHIVGTAPFDVAGDVVAGVGDLNGDGYDDVALSAPHNVTTPNGQGDLDGYIYVVAGPIEGSVSLNDATARLHGELPQELISTAIDGAGDVNGDGFDDLLIGVNNARVGPDVRGITYVEFGPVTGQHELSAADVRLTGEATDDSLGWDVEGVGDTNGDGVEDFLTTAFLADAGGQEDSGAAYLFLGTPHYLFLGFFAPIDNLPVVNQAKAGQTIAVKWRITDADGVGISDRASFVSITSGSTNCSPTDPLDAVETYSGNSGLQYLGNGNWQFNWKTPKSYAGQCRVMRLNLADGSTSRIAEFQFK